MFPLHVLLFVEDRVPPDVKETVDKGGATDEETSQIETAAVLGNEEVYGVGFVVAYGGET